MPSILLIADDPTARRAADALACLTPRIWRSAAEVPAGEAIDVVLTDRPWAAAADDLAVVRMDGQGPADVVLTPDASAREIELACRLLGRIVQLRREMRGQAEDGRKLREEAFSDPLTGIPNRRAWDEELARPGTAVTGPLCLAIIDLDNLKPINDTHGHPLGDRVLQTVGQSLLASVRRGDFVARIGGDEFGLLLPIADPATAAGVVDRVRRQAMSAVLSAGLPPVAASAGIWTFPSTPSPENPPLAIAFAQADAHLLEAKRAGGDCTRG
jgi:diguanylate cyclase